MNKNTESVTTASPKNVEYIIAKSNTSEYNDQTLNGPQIKNSKENEYIVLYNSYNDNAGDGYKIIQAKNIVDVCKKWYEYNCGRMIGLTLKIWKKFKPEEFEDCMAWINSLLDMEHRIDMIICGMYQIAYPSKE